MDLFADQRRQHLAAAAPLAVRMRPRTLDELSGQQHFVGPGKLLRRMLQADRLTSAIFYGPPGCGKTSLAHIVAAMTRAQFVEVNAAAVGVKEIRAILEQARNALETSGARTVLFIDEIHRFNRAQQDVLLGDVENGIVILLGATTENPFFTVNAPLVSRSQIFQFQALTEQDIVELLHVALGDPDRGLGKLKATLDDDAARHLATTSDGDARRALTALEIAALSQLTEGRDANQPVRIDLATAAESIQRKAQNYDAGDAHYDCASALIKSIRGSDPDAAVYWLARMIEGGEDPRFIARRLVIAAAEDIGNADPRALTLAQSAADATAFIGLPECQLPLAQATVYLACAPKSNASAQAIWDAMADVREARTVPVPRSLRDAHYAGSKILGAGEGYIYPHDIPEGIASDQYLGIDKQYYHPTERGWEGRLRAHLARVRAIHEGRDPDEGMDGGSTAS